MIQTEPLDRIPELPWSDYSLREWGMITPTSCDILLRFSSPVKMFSNESGPLMVAGLYRPTLLSTPTFWALLTNGFVSIKPAELKTLVSHLDAEAGDIETMIEPENCKAAKLARLFRFRPTEISVQFGDRMMQIYRRPGWHS